MRLRYSVPLLVVSALLSFLFHYISGPMVALYLIGCAVVMLFHKRRTFPVKWIGAAVGISLVLGIGYYAVVANGVALENLTGGTISMANKTSQITQQPTIIEPFTGTKNPVPTYFHAQEPLIQTALGLDFGAASLTGKAFRVFQIATEIALVLGVWWMVRNRKKLSPEYLGFAISAIVLLGACVFLPRFSNLVNATRFYHLALFVVSPLFIMGALYVFRNLKWAMLLFVPYMLFTTGVVFESTQETDVSKVNIPYSIALSNERVGMVGTFTENDIAVMEYAHRNNLEPVFLDINGVILFSEVEDPFTYQYAQGKYITQVTKGWAYMPQDVSTIKAGYIFLSERNVETQTVDFKPQWFAMKDSATGMRQSYPFSFLGLPRGVVEYQQGRAIILRVGG